MHSDDCVSCESDSLSVSDKNPSLSETSTLMSYPSEWEPSESLSALSSIMSINFRAVYMKVIATRPRELNHSDNAASVKLCGHCGVDKQK